MYIPLDPGDCMCSTMYLAASLIDNFSDFSCNDPEEECTTIRCDGLTQSISLHVNPCDVPPSLQFNVHVFANNHTHEIFANGNQTTSLSDFNGELEITMWHFDYSMDVEVSIH